MIELTYMLFCDRLCLSFARLGQLETRYMVQT